ncbi:hypothetical protein CDAR_314411 [Caerostris darwini]|uniref:Uncharacterized protein n=1 Tax=Caerostris darwini TaxID=1538125 RepID=A0AAV4W7X8_9ARAC|nr:hypothetical protein CDAR_314411 [Caerostris darwini]
MQKDVALQEISRLPLMEKSMPDLWKKGKNVKESLLSSFFWSGRILFEANRIPVLYANDMYSKLLDVPPHVTVMLMGQSFSRYPPDRILRLGGL